MIGKMTGDKIKGVFLNYWGVGGTWTAERGAKTLSEANSAPPASVNENPIMASDVAYHESARYPGFAMDAGIQGGVQLRVETNGYSATKIDAESGNPFLVRAAIGDLRTWRFANHNPQTFDVIYNYQLLNSLVQFLKEPGVVEVDGIPPVVNGGGAYLDMPPDVWYAEFTSSRGNMRATLSLRMTGDMPYDYPSGDVVGPGSKKEEIREAHQDGDMLGFDATVTGPNGKPLKISVLGKKMGNKITGVFLDYSGTPGTWTAVRQLSHAKPTR
jgi:hypothetical protein